MTTSPPSDTAALDFEEEPPTRAEEAEHPERVYERPVAWLFGRQFINSLKGTLIYAAFGNKLDPRDWMNPRAYTFAAGAPAPPPPSPAGGAAALYCPPPWSKRSAEPEVAAPGDFWFDYLSDTGDGVKAVYSLAYLCMSDLWVKDPGDEPHADPRDSFAEKEKKEGYDLRLPRGSFLMVGGDTAYHMSDYATLASRFQVPFRWAFQDLERNLGDAFDRRRRPLFGIPGNHDYYDQLDGFRRQFRRTIRPEPVEEPDPEAPENFRNPQLLIPGFVRCQEASYVALELPHGWWLWGLDTEVPGVIDERQRKFFRDLASQATGLGKDRAPASLDKLIVATCAPTTVFGKFPDRDDEKSSKAFYQLGLPRPFLQEDELEKDDSGAVTEPLLGGHQCRLDISGDVHHYARYWGPADTARPRVRRDGPDRRPPDSPNYVSVVSGLGGAFHHPSQTYKGEIEEHALYPSEAVSRREVAKEVFRFWNLINGGMVWLVGFILAFVIYCGVMVSQSSSEFVHSFPFWERTLGLFEQKPVRPTVLVAERQDIVEQFWSGDTWRVPPPPTDPPICAGINSAMPECARGCEAPRYFLGSCAVAETPGEYKAGVALTIVSLLLIVAGFILGDRLFRDPDAEIIDAMKGLPSDTEEEAERRCEQQGERPGRREWYQERPFQMVGLLALAVIVTAALAVLSLKPYRAHLTPFGNSMMVLVTLIWAVASAVTGVRYSEWLFWKSSVRKLSRWDWALTWVLSIFPVLSLGAGLWIFGKNNRAAFLVADIVFALVVLIVVIGVTLLGYFKAGEMRDGWARKIPYGLLGFTHMLLQLAAAFLIVRKGTWWTVAALAVVVALFGWLGRYLMSRDLRWPLAAAWVAQGVIVLLLPWLTWVATGRPDGTFLSQRGLLPGYDGWWGLVPAFAAGVIGAVLCCVWLGWYFAVSLAFHGHNNEIAGAARIERFKQFVRVRINKEGLTGYVIAIDYPKRNGKHLRPRLVDVFHIRPRP